MFQLMNGYLWHFWSNIRHWEGGGSVVTIIRLLLSGLNLTERLVTCSHPTNYQVPSEHPFPIQESQF